jgi:hypothetical protein
VQLPTNIDFWDGCDYEATVVATDTRTGLSSEPASCELHVSWQHQAAAPTGVVVRPYDTIDADGTHRIGCSVALPALSQAQQEKGDLSDVWRVTPDGTTPLAIGVPGDVTLDDPCAPYGNAGLAYRVVVRTANGDVELADFPYRLACGVLRIDFGDTYVELPYNIAQQDSWEKDFEARRKMDGTVDGYWSHGSTRKGGFSADLVRVKDVAMARRVRELARHTGQCWVRTPEGSAYAADVQVTDLSASFQTAALAVSLDAHEVAPGSEWSWQPIEGV